MFDWNYARNAIAAAVLAGSAAWAYEASGASGGGAEPPWSFEMWCQEMQLYPVKRCDARLADDLREYQQYRADVEKYNDTQTSKAKRDQEILQRLNQNLPGSSSQTGR